MLLTSPAAFLATTYDYVIVGAGTAGLTLAARLSAHPNVTVGVLEAGTAQFDNPLVYMPGMFGLAQRTPVDWNFTSVPQAALAAPFDIITQNRGKMVGGSSGLNYMLWNRASAPEYDAWAALGNDGWDWPAMLAASKAVEHVHAPSTAPQKELAPHPPFVPAVHGTHGPIQTSFSRWYVRAALAFLPALTALTGRPPNAEPMSGSNLGGYVSLVTVDARNDTRSYAATSYLEPHLARPNLQVLTGALAGRVLFSPATAAAPPRATAVTFAVGNATFSVRARREVVLAAGAVQSPQLLELSGIGGAARLAALGVAPVHANAAVGANLHDHYQTPVVWRLPPGVLTQDALAAPAALAAAEAAFAANRSGVAAGTQTHYAMLPLADIATPAEAARIRALARAETAARRNASSAQDRAVDAALLRLLSRDDVAHVEVLLTTRNAAASLAPAPGAAYLSLSAAVMHPFSRGSVHAGAAAAAAPPVYDPRVYSSAVDRAVIVAGLRFVARLGATPPLSAFLAERVSPPAAMGALADADWWAYVQNNTLTVHHPVGTCAMLPQGLGVVDARLRVWGVRGLRVVDASIMPTTLAAHSQLSVYAIAERAAALIMEEW